MRTPRVAIVGAGISGICTAVLMKNAGLTEFTMYEGADDVGGVWRDNRYPGLHCDLPSRGYSFTFAPKSDWKLMYSSGPDIHTYLRDVADTHGLRKHIRFRTTVTGAQWVGDQWEVTDSAGNVEKFDFLVSAVGLLNIPSIPDIPGMESFRGDICHSAQWKDIPLKGRRIAVVGTGSSGVQLVSALADQARELLHITRTPQWVLPGFNTSLSKVNHWIMRHSPRANRMAHRAVIWMYDLLSTAMLWNGFMRKSLNVVVRRHLASVKDPVLRSDLMPDYPLGCKRPVTSGTYYKAIQKPNVSFVKAGVDSIDATGLTTSDGVHHPVDVIVLATGFKFSRPMQGVVGDSGQLLDQVWAQSPVNYRSVAVSGFPNFFLVNGPPTAQTSLCWSAEVHAGYLVQWLELYRDGKVDRVAVTQQAQDEYQAKLTKHYPETVYTSCQSYYLSADGTPMVLSMVFAELAKMLRQPVLKHFCTTVPSPPQGEELKDAKAIAPSVVS